MSTTLHIPKEVGEEGCPIVYEDETCINSNPTGPKNCSDGSALGKLAHVSRGEQHVVLHVGGMLVSF